jgi:hypothetical protein
MTNAKVAARAQRVPLIVTEAAAAPPTGALALALALSLAFRTPSVGRIELASFPSVLCGEVR